MTLSGGATSGSSGGTHRGSWSEGDIQLQAQMELKRKRRKESNRESAKRSRLRKQQHLDDLNSQVNQLKAENQQLGATLSMVTQSYAAAEAQNSVLRTQRTELDSRLRALREIVFYLNTPTQLLPAAYPSTTMTAAAAAAASGHYYDYYDAASANPWSSSGMQMMQQQQQPMDQFLLPVLGSF
ncbi:bZIP transcription factor 11-like [Oryza brachyantha]|uniref:BZIP domain-containing protein n=1 Tax=Oryza brachyantha TaxID=4533 RepID=J3MSH0_ORYBR|nr:bZIP transcription factor 11-like [Oryza brachyantha]